MTLLDVLLSLQLAEHYANCMKLSAENKINVKNAFNLGLIDYMAEMVRKKAPGMDNFQVSNFRCIHIDFFLPKRYQ